VRSSLVAASLLVLSMLTCVTRTEGQINKLNAELSKGTIGPSPGDSSHYLKQSSSSAPKVNPRISAPANLSFPERLIPAFVKNNSISSISKTLSSPPFQVVKTQLSAQGTTQMNAFSGAMDHVYNNEVSAAVSLFNMPFSTDYHSATGWQSREDHTRFTSVKFDKNMFLQQLSDKIRKELNPEELFEDALRLIYEQRDKAFSKLQGDLSSFLSGKNPQLLAVIKDKINPENITRMGTEWFLSNLLEQGQALLKEKELLLSRLQLRNAQEVISDDSLQVALAAFESQSKANEDMQQSIPELRDQWLKNGILEKIAGFEKVKKAAIDKLLQEPDQLRKVALDKFKLQGLRKLLLHANSFSIGSSGVDQGALGIKDALLNGINASFLKGNRFFAPVIGKIPGIKNMSDLRYANFSELPDIITTALRIGKGGEDANFSHVSFSLLQPVSNSSIPVTAFSLSLPKNLVSTFSKQLTIGSAHTLLAEISKSTLLQPSSGTSGIKDLVNSDNLFGNMGLNVQYRGEFEQLGLTQQTTIRYTGKEYSNMGNFALVSGAKEISNDLKKYFLQRKLIINFKGNYREYDFSASKRKWKNFSYLADVKLKLKKGEFIELRYQPNINRRSSPEESYTSSKSFRLAVRGVVNRKLGRNFRYRNFMEISTSQDDLYDFYRDQFYSNQFTSFTSLQTFTLGKNNLFLNLNGNIAKQQTGYLLGNSSLSADAGIHFTSRSALSASSSAVYTSVKGIYQQIAIRQSVSTTIGKRFVIDGYIHAGINKVTQSYPDIPAVSGNLSISYHLK
jgi:hypothetical protein